MFKLFKKKNNNLDEQLISFIHQQLTSNEKLQEKISETIHNEICRSVSNSFNYGSPVSKALNDIFNESIKQVISKTDFVSYVGCLEMIFNDVIKSTEFEYNKHTIEIFKNILGNTYVEKFQKLMPEELFDMYLELVAKDLAKDFDFFEDNNINTDENCAEVECTMHIEIVQSKHLSNSRDIIITFMCSEDEDCKYNAQMRFMCYSDLSRKEAMLLHTSAESKPLYSKHIGNLTLFDSFMIQANRKCCGLSMENSWEFETDFSSTKTVEVYLD